MDGLYSVSIDLSLSPRMQQDSHQLEAFFSTISGKEYQLFIILWRTTRMMLANVSAPWQPDHPPVLVPRGSRQAL